jgi:hypothetical protein
MPALAIAHRRVVPDRALDGLVETDALGWHRHLRDHGSPAAFALFALRRAGPQLARVGRERRPEELLDGEHRDPDHGSPAEPRDETTRCGQPNRAAHAWNDVAPPFRAALVTPGHVASLQCS